MEENKKIDLVERLEEKTNHFINTSILAPSKIESISECFIKSYYNVLKKPISGIDLLLSEASKLSVDGMKKFKEFSLKFYTFARYSSIPWSYIWLYLWKVLRYRHGNLLMTRGVHYITALQGGGKSSLLFHLIEELRDTTGKASYVNADIEKEQLDDQSGMMVKYHKYFEFDEFYGRVVDPETNKEILTQKKRFNVDHFNNIVFDEWLAEMNHRMNNTTSYKDLFIPLMKSLSRMRHQGIMRVYIASQLDTTDIQLMGLFKMIHEVEIDLDIDYKQWLQDGMFQEHIKGWTIWTYQYRRNKKKGATEKQLVKRWYYKRTYDMSNFITLSQAKTFYGLPVDQIKTTKGVI